MNASTAMQSADVVAALLFILSLAGLSQHRTSRAGVVFGIGGMALALIVTIVFAGRHISGGAVVLILVAMAVGAVIGLWRARVVEMTGMPELIAMLHSFVGLSAVLVGWNSYLDVEARGSGRPRSPRTCCASTTPRCSSASSSAPSPSPARSSRS